MGSFSQSSVEAHPPRTKQALSFKLINPGSEEALEVQSPQLTTLIASLRDGLHSMISVFEMPSRWKIIPVYPEVCEKVFLKLGWCLSFQDFCLPIGTGPQLLI